MPVFFLDLFSLVNGQAQPVGDIRCDMVAAYRKHHGVPDVAVDVDCQISGAAADIANDGAHGALGFGEHNLGGSQRVEHELGSFHTGGLHALAQVFDSGFSSRDDVRFHFHTVAVHSDGSTDAV